MLLGKIILGISALAFVGYGLVSLVSPEVPAGLVDLQMNSGDAFAEVAAIYGGLQTALGVFFLLALINPAHYRAGLLVLLLVMGGLALARFIALWVTADAIGSYTVSALAFEAAMALLAAYAYWNKNNDST
jgi:hypothetical protein